LQQRRRGPGCEAPALVAHRIGVRAVIRTAPVPTERARWVRIKNQKLTSRRRTRGSRSLAGASGANSRVAHPGQNGSRSRPSLQDVVELLAERRGNDASSLNGLVFPGEEGRGFLSPTVLLRRYLYPAMAAAEIGRVGPTHEKRTFHSTGRSRPAARGRPSILSAMRAASAKNERGRDAIGGWATEGSTSPRLSPPCGRKRHPAQSVNYPPPRPSNGLVCRRGAPGNHGSHGGGGVLGGGRSGPTLLGTDGNLPEILSIPTYEIGRARAVRCAKTASGYSGRLRLGRVKYIPRRLERTPSPWLDSRTSVLC
jgi:hypothetical protein